MKFSNRDPFSPSSRAFSALITFCSCWASLAEATLILHNGEVVTVDRNFTIQQAICIENDRIIRVGSNSEILKLKGPETRVIDLQGRMVLPGLMDSHAHPADACMTEFDHPIPEIGSIAQVLDYVAERARIVPAGQWIEVHQIFITRLKERRYPTRAELDQAAPQHPVIFQTGPDASLNSIALKLSSIDRDFKVSDGGSGFAEKDPATGEPTGILRNCSRYVKVVSNSRKPTLDDWKKRLIALFADYNSIGLTSICDRDTSPDELSLFKTVHDEGKLSVRVAVSHDIRSIGRIEEIEANIRRVATDPFFKPKDDLLRIIGIKTFLDGGMLTGSAYMREPWGKSKIYGITDPDYRGVLFIEKDKLRRMVKTATEAGLQFTAHSVGDGAVHTLLDVYEDLAREIPLARTRPCISHSNFMSQEAVRQAARLGISLDIQPAWLFLDGPTLLEHFGQDRLRYFQPLRSAFEAGAIAGGGSDHMQKIGPDRSINPYNPFLGIATAVTRVTRSGEAPLHPEEALSRAQAIRFYTINNAKILFLDDRAGSLERGKLADLIVLDRNLLTCPAPEIRGTRVLLTLLGGKVVHAKAPFGP
jgi:predicted amidohydrolase YtcJ